MQFLNRGRLGTITTGTAVTKAIPEAGFAEAGASADVLEALRHGVT